MRKNIDISDKQIGVFLEQFYSYFDDGYAFEEFLKVYLEKIGLDEVIVTQRSADGGIDLKAVRYGVVFTPTFSRIAMDALKDSNDEFSPSENLNEEGKPPQLIIEKQISSNDIRAKILRMPKAVSEIIGKECSKVSVIFNGLPEKQLTVAKSRAYLARVTELYKESGLISEDGSFNPCKAIWKCYENRIEITIKE